MLFNFESNEISAVMKLIADRMQELTQQPQSLERNEEIYALGEFTVKMGPVIEEHMIQETRQFNAQMN